MRKTRSDTVPVEERFWQKADKSGGENSCWQWTASKNRRGYGRICKGRNGKARVIGYAHRIAYEIAKGPIPEGQCVLHTCDNPSCVNPAHLFVGTHADNMADMIAKGRAIHNGLKGESNGRAKLTVKSILEIRAMRDKATYGEIGKMFGVASSTIGRIISLEKWAHVHPEKDQVK